MADKKISQLTGASTPVAGTEVLPIVQSGATVKVSIDNLTAGKSVSGASFVPTGSTVPANGMFLSSANSVGFASNSTEHWVVNASGNFNPVGSKGIGTNAAPVSEAVATTFSTSAAAAGSNLNGNTLAADGTDTNININITPKGTGEVVLPKVNIDAGAIDGTPIGANSASTGAFTTLSASSTVSGTGFSTYLASPPAIGGTVAAAGAFTTLSASSTVSGTGFSTYLASPPAIGGTAAAAGSFTKLNVSTTQRILSKSATVAKNASGTCTISASDFSGAEIEGSMLIIAGGYGQAASGNVLGMWLIGGWLFLNDASTSTVVEIANSVGNGTLTCARSGSTYVVTLNNTNLDYSKTLRVSAILNG